MHQHAVASMPLSTESLTTPLHCAHVIFLCHMGGGNDMTTHVKGL